MRGQLSDKEFKRLFALMLISFGLFGLAVLRASFPQWSGYQRDFQRFGARPIQIEQILLPKLQRVDRCVTCHLGYDDPSLKDAPEPFRFHAGLEAHPPETFGCTGCHGGQGLATEVPDAHGGPGIPWPEPLRPKEFLHAACAQCHTGEVPGAPEIAEGERLYAEYGCNGCHKLDGAGGKFGPDLTLEATKERSPDWLARHFLKPRDLVQHSAMPDFGFTEAQARALTVLMLSKTGATFGELGGRKRQIPGAAWGRRLFEEKACMSCHTLGGGSGGSGDAAKPDLLGVTSRRTRGLLHVLLADPRRIDAASTMPGYALTQDEREAILMFLDGAKAADGEELLASSRLTPEQASIEAGRAGFVRAGCVGCHNRGGKGGFPNDNAQGGEVPSMLHVADDYTRAEVLDLLRNGREAPAADAKGTPPPLAMPAWKAVLTEEEMNSIVDYLWSLRPKEASDW